MGRLAIVHRLIKLQVPLKAPLLGWLSDYWFPKKNSAHGVIELGKKHQSFEAIVVTP
jgi:hypothetical protein